MRHLKKIAPEVFAAPGRDYYKETTETKYIRNVV